MNGKQFLVMVLMALAAAAPSPAGEPSLQQELHKAETVYRRDGPALALPLFEELHKAFMQAGDDRNVAITEGYIGALHWRLGNFDAAREYLNSALTQKRAAGLRLEVGKTLNVLGLLEWDLGNFDAAIAYFSQAGEIGREIGDAKLEGATLNNLSLVHDELGDYDTSLDQYQRALGIYRNAKFQRGMGDTLGNIGGVHLLLGQFSKAADYYRRALEISQRMGSVPAMSQDHGNLGLSYSGMGRIDLAIVHFDEALRLAEKAGMRQEQGYWLRGLANAEIQTGRLDLGLEHHRAAVKIYEEIDSKGLLLDALHDLGRLYMQLGDPTSADRYFHRAMDLAVETGLERAVTANQIALGDLQRRHQQYEAARALFQQSLARARDAGELGLQSRALLRLAVIDLEQGSPELALPLTEQALAIARETQAQPDEIHAIFLKAESIRQSGDPKQALNHYRLARNLSDELMDSELAWQIEYGRGLALQAAGQKRAAVDALLSAVRHIESVRNRLKEERFQAGYLQDKYQVYITLARLQLELGETFEAFSTAERLRQWSFSRYARKSASAETGNVERLEQTELQERIRRLQRNLESENARPIPERRQLAVETFSRELLLAEQDYQALLDDHLGRSHSGITTPQFRKSELQGRLQNDEALLEYMVGPDFVMVFVMTSHSLWALSVPAAQPDLNSRLKLLRDLLAQHENELWKTPAASLAETLLAPVLESGRLDGISHLYVVPHGILNYLPFALMPTDSGSSGESLIDRYTLAYLPTASALAGGDADPLGSDQLLAIAPSRSRLAYAQEEATSIARLFRPRADVVLGDAATESWFKENAGNYGILHLATHGYFNKLNPLLSGLQLESDSNNDGLLEVHEILDLQLQSELVTLSACETGLASGYFNDLPAGDDFVGLTRAFLQVGSNSVFATLWEVDDRSTVELMKQFYSKLEASGSSTDKARALVRAQQSLRNADRFKHPYYWAPFVLVGDIQREDKA